MFVLFLKQGGELLTAAAGGTGATCGKESREVLLQVLISRLPSSKLSPWEEGASEDPIAVLSERLESSHEQLFTCSIQQFVLTMGW